MTSSYPKVKDFQSKNPPNLYQNLAHTFFLASTNAKIHGHTIPKQSFAQLLIKDEHGNLIPRMALPYSSICHEKSVEEIAVAAQADDSELMAIFDD